MRLQLRFYRANGAIHYKQVVGRSLWLSYTNGGARIFTESSEIAVKMAKHTRNHTLLRYSDFVIFDEIKISVLVSKIRDFGQYLEKRYKHCYALLWNINRKSQMICRTANVIANELE